MAAGTAWAVTSSRGWYGSAPRTFMTSGRKGARCGPGEAGYWREVGTIDSYWTRTWTCARSTGVDLYNRWWPILTTYRDPAAKFARDDDGQAARRSTLVSNGVIVSGGWSATGSCRPESRSTAGPR